MSATPTENISAKEWLDIRDEVARRVGDNYSVQAATRTAIAEHLLRREYVDIDAVRVAITPVVVANPDHEAIADFEVGE